MNKQIADIEEIISSAGKSKTGASLKFFLETYGCQMNFSDSELVTSILLDQGYIPSATPSDADLILTNTCAIRENAEEKVRKRLYEFRKLKLRNPELVVGILGCMAERLKEKLVEEEDCIDLVVGPDAYRTLPACIAEVREGRKGVNVILSKEETYSDIQPVRLGGNGVTALISIMRGCDNMCSFCVVPFTRGRERSRNPDTIVNEARNLFSMGYREVTLLGQNVNSYQWNDTSFAKLLERVAMVSPLLRIRFSTSNPQDMTDEVLYTIKKFHNICKYIHLPVQSGSDRVLQIMNRSYNRSFYLERIKAIREIIPGCGISTDIIAGFCSETEEEHAETLTLMQEAGYNFAYMFKYSERPGTLAARKYKDDIPEEVKSRRLSEIIELHRQISHQSNINDLNTVHEVLVEGRSRKSSQYMFGRNTQNKVIVFPADGHKQGTYVQVLVKKCTTATLIGEVING